jgi:probable phosphoglycerate mutase
VRERIGLHLVVLDDLRGLDMARPAVVPARIGESMFGGSPQGYPDRPYALGTGPWTSYLQRAVRTLSRVLAEHDGQRVLIAGHAGTIVAANTLLLGLPGGAGSLTGFVVDHASLTWPQQAGCCGHVTWRMVRHNDTGHLGCRVSRHGEAERAEQARSSAVPAGPCTSGGIGGQDGASRHPASRWPPVPVSNGSGAG